MLWTWRLSWMPKAPSLIRRGSRCRHALRSSVRRPGQLLTRQLPLRGQPKAPASTSPILRHPSRATTSQRIVISRAICQVADSASRVCYAHTVREAPVSCRLAQQEMDSAGKAAQASAALPSTRASLERNRSAAAACAQKAEELRQQRQRLQVQSVHSHTQAHMSCAVPYGDIMRLCSVPYVWRRVSPCMFLVEVSLGMSMPVKRMLSTIAPSVGLGNPSAT